VKASPFSYPYGVFSKSVFWFSDGIVSDRIFKDREAEAPAGATEKQVSPAPPGLKWFYQFTHGFTVGYRRTLLRS
jgi:hypothetical protein